MSCHQVRVARQTAPTAISPLFRLTPTARVIQAAFVGSLLAVAGWQPQAHAQTVSPQPRQAAAAAHRYDIPAGSLSTVLARFASESGVLLAASGELTQGKTSQGLSGSYTVNEGFEQIVRGQGLQVVQGEGGIHSLRAALANNEAAALPAVAVTAAVIDPAKQANPPTTVGSKTPLTQREIPQTVSVVTQEQIQSQNMRTVDDAMRFAPGVTTEINQPGFTSYYSRGFPISTTQLDSVPTGIATSGISGPTDGLAMYDRVEVLYGPAGLYNGFGGDGGVINLVRKRAPDHFTGSVSAAAGNYANSDFQADIGGPLNEARTLRGRLVADEQYQHLMQEGTWQRNQQVYGTLEADLSPTTLARAGFSYTDIAGKPMYGFPNYTNYTIPDIPRSTYLGPDWNHFANRRAMAFAQVEQKLAGDWVAKLSYNYMHTTTDVLSGAMITADPDSGLSNRYSLNTNDINSQHALDLYLDGPFKLLGRTHHLTVGANYLRIHDLTNQYLINPDTGLDFEGDITAPFYDNSAYSRDFAGGPENDITNVSTQYGVYGNARFSLADPLTLVLSGRFTWWKNNSTPDSDPNKNFFGNVAVNDRLPPKFSPAVGLVYDINDRHTVYGSYSTIYIPQPGDETVNGEVIKPVQGSQYEIGEKGEYFDGRLTTSVALFRIRESNRAAADPIHPGFDIAQGKVQSQGVELRANGQITPNWVIGGGYTYTNWKTYDDSFSSHQQFSVVAPKHLFKLWSSYRLPGDLHQWEVGGAMYVSSRVFYTDKTGFISNNTLPGGTITAPGYAIFDAHVSYRINKSTTASLAISNLFDRKYLTSLTTGGLGNYYGNPRMALLTLRANF